MHNDHFKQATKTIFVEYITGR